MPISPSPLLQIRRASGERDNVILALVRKLAQSAPQEAIRWLEPRLPEVSPVMRQSWW